MVIYIIYIIVHIYIYNYIYNHIYIYTHIWAPVKILYVSVVAIIGYPFLGGHIVFQCFVPLSLLGGLSLCTSLKSASAILQWSSTNLTATYIHTLHYFTLHYIPFHTIPYHTYIYIYISQICDQPQRFFSYTYLCVNQKNVGLFSPCFPHKSSSLVTHAGVLKFLLNSPRQIMSGIVKSSRKSSSSSSWSASAWSTFLQQPQKHSALSPEGKKSSRTKSHFQWSPTKSGVKEQTIATHPSYV